MVYLAGECNDINLDAEHKRRFNVRSISWAGLSRCVNAGHALAWMGGERLRLGCL